MSAPDNLSESELRASPSGLAEEPDVLSRKSQASGRNVSQADPRRRPAEKAHLVEVRVIRDDGEAMLLGVGPDRRVARTGQADIATCTESGNTSDSPPT